jgi:hypothetical protein
MGAPVMLPSILLFFVGIMFGCMPLIAAFRQLPRWIRFGLHSSGAAFFIAGALLVARYAFASHISPGLHRFIFAHILVICGMGFGILFLLAASGEYFKALRALDAARRKTLSDAHDEHATNTPNQSLEPTTVRRDAHI